MDNSGDEAIPPSLTSQRLHAPNGLFWGWRKTNKSTDPPAIAKTLLRPRRKFPGPKKAHSGKTTATIPSDAPTSPPAPGHTAAPAGKDSATKKDTRQRITAHSARTRSQVTPNTRPTVAEKNGATTPRDQAKQSGAQKITQRSPSVSAAHEQTPDKRTNAPSAPPTIRAFCTLQTVGARLHRRVSHPGRAHTSHAHRSSNPGKSHESHEPRRRGRPPGR